MLLKYYNILLGQASNFLLRTLNKVLAVKDLKTCLKLKKKTFKNVKFIHVVNAPCFTIIPQKS